MASQKLPEFESNAARIPKSFFRPKRSGFVRHSPTAIRAFAGMMLVKPDKDGFRTIDRRGFSRLSGLGRTQADIGIAELIAANVVERPPLPKTGRRPRNEVSLRPLVDLSGNYTILPETVVSSELLDSADLVVLATLLSHWNRDSGFCFPAIEKLAEEAGMPRRCAVRRIGNLRTAGVVKRIQRGYDQSSQTWFEWLNPERFAPAEMVVSSDDLVGWTPVAELVPPIEEEDMVAGLATVHQLPVKLEIVPDDAETNAVEEVEEFDPINGPFDAVPSIENAFNIAAKVRRSAGAGYVRTAKERQGARRLTTNKNTLMRPLTTIEITLMLIYSSGHKYLGSRANSLSGLPEHANEIFFSHGFARYVEDKAPDHVGILPPKTKEYPALAPIRGQLLADNTTDYSSWEGEL